jgi:NitT/TauT family transport system substrate-binding protein
VVVTRGDYLRGHADVVNDFVQAVGQGWRSYLEDPTQANQMMGQLNQEMDAPTFIAAAKAQQSLIETAETKANGLGTMTQERWGALIGQLSDLKLIDHAPTAGECFQNPEKN